MGRIQCYLLALLVCGGAGSTENREFAYVTLASGPVYILAARTLAHSMDEAGCKHPRVIMLTFDAPATVRRQLIRERWDVRDVPRLPSPYDDKGEMTRQTFSMLWAFNQTDFKRMLYIDTDFIVVNNVDELFNCGVWCAAYSNRERGGRFNAGLQVITPSSEFFEQLVSDAVSGQFTSYNRGVQGFLNEAMPHWCSFGAVRSWVKFTRRAWSNSGNWRECTALEETYNRLAVDEADDPVLRDKKPANAIHFNHPVFWAVKPWVWYWYPLLPTNWLWRKHRAEVQGEGARRVLIAVLGVLAPLMVSFAAVLGLRPFSVASCSKHAVACSQEPKRGRRFRLAQWAKLVLLSVFASVAVFFALPSNVDALMAWVSYFTLKGCALGLLTPQVLQRGRVRWTLRVVLCGYLCAAVEALGIYFPQSMGFNWVSNTQVNTFCDNRAGANWFASWAYRNLECHATMIMLFAMIIVAGLCCQLILLQIGVSRRRAPHVTDEDHDLEDTDKNS